MLDNIKARNYVNVDRFIGFDTDETLAVVKVQKIQFLISIRTFFRIILIFVNFSVISQISLALYWNETAKT